MLVKLILGLVLAGGAYVVAANSHFDIFPCKETTEDFDTGQTRTEDSTCSIMQVQRAPIGKERAELTPVGYATAVGVLGVAPLILGFLLGGFFTRKK
ncbi:MAG: hypothetical protein JNL82_23805 [Myxococcales bacterium]|nr:hypothetical protein [Myxococcales bacterium]